MRVEYSCLLNYNTVCLTSLATVSHGKAPGVGFGLSANVTSPCIKEEKEDHQISVILLICYYMSLSWLSEHQWQIGEWERGICLNGGNKV